MDVIVDSTVEFDLAMSERNGNGNDDPSELGGMPHRYKYVQPRAITTQEALLGYATMAANYDAFVNDELPALKKEIDDTKGAAFAACGMAQQARDAVLEVKSLMHAAAQESKPYDRRQKLPSFHEYHPDETPAGGIKITPEMWDRIRQRQVTLERELAEKEAEKRGAEEALKKQHEAALDAAKLAEVNTRKWRNRVGIIVAVLSTAGGGLAWLIHTFKL